MYLNPKKRRRGITIEKYDIDWSDSEGETDQVKPTDETEEAADQEKAVDQEKAEIKPMVETEAKIELTTEIKPIDEIDKIELTIEPVDQEKTVEAEIETLQVTRQDLADWGIEASIAEICQKIGEQLKERCLQEVLEGYLKDPSYCRNPTNGFRRIFQKRGNIQQLKIPEDLPLVALHKLHETPEYLNQIHHDRIQVLRELTEKHAEVD